MKYLYGHAETLRNLQVWSGNAPLITACFYFWSPGQRMQKSLEGLLQTLLFHILHACPELAPTICPERWDAESQFPSSHITSQMPWTLPELQRSLELFTTQKAVTSKFYFQVDGLDEYYGDSWEVIETLRNLSNTANVKICLSSRPWNCFQDSFGRANPDVVRVHEFTRPDIELFARENLQSHRVYTDFESSEFEQLLQDIGERAQGVFLWVRLVVRSLCNGFENEDPISILRQRVREIPSDLEDFFDQIMGSVEGIYRSRMASTFLAAMRSSRQLNLINYYFLEPENSTLALDMPSKRWRHSTIQECARRTERRLNGRFKGLLEATSTVEISAKTKVDFLHRTLSDFLATKRVEEKLQVWASQELNVFTAISRALIAESKFIVDSSSASTYKLAVKLACKGAVETRDIAHCYALLDQAESENERMRPSHSKCGLNCYILRQATSLGHVKYLEYRMQKDDDTLDLNCILRHTIACPVGPDEADDSCLPSADKQNGMVGQYKDWLNPSLPGPVANAPLPSLVKVLFELGADPNAVVDRTSNWYALAGEAIRIIDTKRRAEYWAVLELFLKRGADANRAAEYWIDILDRADPVSGKIPQNKLREQSLRNTLRHFECLFDHRLDPNTLSKGTTITRELIQMLIRNSSWSSDDSPGLQLELLHKFLQHGADISVIAGSGWISDLCKILPDLNRRDEVSPRIAQYCMLLQHGLNPNELTHEDCTLWERLLETLHHGIQHDTWDPVYHQAVQTMFLVSLQYGADPKADKIQEVLCWMRVSQFSLPNNRFDEIEKALQAELTQTRHQTQRQHNGLEEATISKSSTHLPPAVAQETRQMENRDHVNMSRDSQGIRSKHLRVFRDATSIKAHARAIMRSGWKSLRS